MIPYLSIGNLKNDTLSRGTYLYSPYMGVPPLPGGYTSEKRFNFEETLELTYVTACDYCENLYIQRYKKKSKATAMKGTVIYLPTVLAGNQGC